MCTQVGQTGLVLVAGSSCFHIVKVHDVEEQDSVCSKQERAQENNQVRSSSGHSHSFPLPGQVSKVTVAVPGPVLSLGQSCDSLTVSVVVRGEGGPTVYLWDTRWGGGLGLLQY